MGKPSSTRLPKRQHSQESVSKESYQMAGVKKEPINIRKLDVKKKKRNRRTKKKIQKLFDKLRNDSNITIDSSVDNTILLLDDTVQECDTSTSLSRKRKLSETSVLEDNNKWLKIDDPEPVIITDDVILLDSTLPDGSKVNEDLIDDVSENNDITVIKTDVIANNVNTDSNTNDDVVITSAVPSSTKTPRKLAPPMNCSTPITKISPFNSTNNNADSTQNFNIDTNITREINKDSFLTIDLTTETDPNRSSVSKTQFDTVIDLENTQDSQDCTFVSISNTSMSMSGDSDVTVLKNNNSRKRVNKFVNGIAKLDASEKGRLLELITKNIFTGCKIPEKISGNVPKARDSTNKGTDTAETSYIKEVILGQKPSRNSIGSNIYNPGNDKKNKTGLRMIVIDGSNVAMQHGQGRVFSVRGLQICIDYFLKRGHAVKAFVPRFRCKFGKSSEPRLLDALERRGLVVYTPSREIQGRLITSYDDRYIVQCAAEFDGIIVTGDNYRDLHRENPRWRFVIENRLLPFTWVDDMIMFPKDPLGRNGPTLDAFLRHQPPTSSIVL